MSSPSAPPPSLYTDTESEPEPEEIPSLSRRSKERILLPDYSDFATTLDHILGELLYKQYYGRYNSVHVLLVAWKTPTTHEIKELAQLREVFESKLQFTTERYDITREVTPETFEIDLEEAVRIHAGADELLIIYYAGHGHLDKGSHVTFWQPTKDPPSTDNPTPLPLNWTNHEYRLNHSIAKDSDILYILDSCYTPSMRQSSSRGSKELLAASQSDGDYSFTTDLCDELQSQILGTGSISVLDLHSRIARRQARRQAGYQIAEPYHLTLSDKANSSSIVLASPTIHEPRIPTTLKESRPVTLCLIKFGIFQSRTPAPDLWNKYVSKRAVLFNESRAGNKYLGDYVEGRASHNVVDVHLVIVSMPSEVSRMLVKKIGNRAFVELKTVGSAANISNKMVADEMKKAAEARASIFESID